MPLFIQNPMSKPPKTQFLSRTYDMRVSGVPFRKNLIFLVFYPATSPIIPDRPGCLV